MPYLKFENKNNILRIFLNDLKTYNAFSPMMAEEFYKLLVQEKPEALYVSAVGPLFCSGGNLSFYKMLKTRDEGLKYNARIREILDHLDQLKIPKACYVNGPCYGGGVEFLSCFDYVVSHPSALFGLWQRRIGLSFGWGGGPRLHKKIGVSETKKWLGSGQTLSGYQAHTLGLVDEMSAFEVGTTKTINWLEEGLRLGDWDSFFNAPSDKDLFSSLWLGATHKKKLDQF